MCAKNQLDSFIRFDKSAAYDRQTDTGDILLCGCRRGVVVGRVRRMNEVNAPRVRFHNFQLNAKNSSITECDFITRTLVKDVY